MQTFDEWISKNYPMFELIGDPEEDTTARLVRCVAGDLFTKLSTSNALLLEARTKLPYDEAAWKELDARGVAGFNVKCALDLLARIDAFTSASA